MTEMNFKYPYDADRDPSRAERESMVADQVAARGITDPEVLEALRRVPRHEFVPAAQREVAYQDSALPIGYGQTISQPFIVALMTSLAQPARNKRVLEIGTGSGYQAAVLAELGATVYSLEIIGVQAEKSREALARTGYADRAHVIHRDGFLGYPEAAPFDVILVTCAVPETPGPLLEQLARGGRIILPLGETLSYQTLTVVTRSPQGRPVFQPVTGVVFVPMTGPHGFKPGLD